MIEFTTNQLHKNTEKIVNDLVNGNYSTDAVKITTDHGNVILTTEEEWNILVEAMQMVIREHT